MAAITRFHSFADFRPLLTRQFLRIVLSELRQHGSLYFGRKDRQERDEVCVCAGMRLHVGMFGVEEFAGQPRRLFLDGVYVIAPGIEAMARIAFGIFVRK